MPLCLAPPLHLALHLLNLPLIVHLNLRDHLLFIFNHPLLLRYHPQMLLTPHPRTRQFTVYIPIMLRERLDFCLELLDCLLVLGDYTGFPQVSLVGLLELADFGGELNARLLGDGELEREGVGGVAGMEELLLQGVHGLAEFVVLSGESVVVQGQIIELSLHLPHLTLEDEHLLSLLPQLPLHRTLPLLLLPPPLLLYFPRPPLLLPLHLLPQFPNLLILVLVHTSKLLGEFLGLYFCIRQNFDLGGEVINSIQMLLEFVLGCHEGMGFLLELI